jgi:hypothetical protein
MARAGGRALARTAGTSVLLAAVLFASVLPCAASTAPAAPSPRVQGHAHREGVEAHAPSLSAPCHCGCAKTPGRDVSSSRLPLALLLARPAASAPALAPLADEPAAGAPDSPAPLVEHVPRHRLA